MCNLAADCGDVSSACWWQSMINNTNSHKESFNKALVQSERTFLFFKWSLNIVVHGYTWIHSYRDHSYGSIHNCLRLLYTLNSHSFIYVIVCLNISFFQPPIPLPATLLLAHSSLTHPSVWPCPSIICPLSWMYITCIAHEHSLALA